LYFVANKTVCNNILYDTYFVCLLQFSFEHEKYVVIICSTTGEGEPPETVLKFWRRIKRTTLPANHLCHISYSLLGTQLLGSARSR